MSQHIKMKRDRCLNVTNMKLLQSTLCPSKRIFAIVTVHNQLGNH